MAVEIRAGPRFTKAVVEMTWDGPCTATLPLRTSSGPLVLFGALTRSCRLRVTDAAQRAFSATDAPSTRHRVDAI